MAYQTALTDWILRNDERFDLRVQELTWIRNVFPGWYDLQVSISVFGEKFLGRGSDKNSNVALGKAFCEAVERSVCFRHGISSLGVAGHWKGELAGENARLEWIERASFAHQIENRLALEPIAHTEPEVLDRYRAIGIAIDFFRIVSPVNTPVVLCLADGAQATPTFGGIMGLGASADLEAAKRKALFECLRSLEFFLHTKSASLGEEEFRRIEKPTAQDRQALIRDLDYFRLLRASLSHPPQAVRLPEGKLQLLALDPAFKGCPLIFMRYAAASEILQPEFLA